MLTVRRAPRERVAVPALLGSAESVTALVVAHAAAGGEAPQSWWLLAFGVLVYGAGRVVLRGRARIGVVLPALLAAQVLGHAWLVALAPSGHGGHGHAGDLGGGALLGLTPAMLAAHVVAAAVTGVMWALRRRAVEVLLQWTEPHRGPVLVTLRSAVPTHAVPAARWFAAARPTRGPPALLPATA
ncbi:hypothetical protein [Nocardioides sp. J54]|uniref:hypothetical protein n=1 Tax=Nocardioides sp. J54 TaxID=935866 RepID=UPI000559E508|nr:hypothetical protein [Nocardioides sp. J54]